MVAGGLEVLSDRDDVARIASRWVLWIALTVVFRCACDQIVEHLEDFFFALADPDHDPGFGNAALRFDSAEQFDGPFIFGAWAHRGVTTLDGFEIVRQNIGLCVDDHLQCGFVASEVPHQHFDGHVWTGLACAHDGFCPDPGAPVWKIITID